MFYAKTDKLFKMRNAFFYLAEMLSILLLMPFKRLFFLFLFSSSKLNIHFFKHHNEILYCFFCVFFQSTFPCFTLQRKGWSSYARISAVLGNRNSPVERWKEFKTPDLQTSASVYDSLFTSDKHRRERDFIPCMWKNTKKNSKSLSSCSSVLINVLISKYAFIATDNALQTLY